MIFCKKLLGFAVKILFAGIAAIISLSVLMAIYSLSPVHIPNDGGNTDYVWPSGSLWSCMSEGIGYGKFDENGFNNQGVIDNPDILILGSSHTEAKNVLQDQNYASLLASKLKNEYSVYNQGISGHNLYKVCQYLETSITQFEKAPKYIIIETDNVSLTDEKVQQVLTQTVEYTPSYNTGIIALLQKVPFFHQLYAQLDGGLFELFMSDRTSSDDSVSADGFQNASAADSIVDTAPYETLLSYIQNLQEKYETQVLIFYHPTGELQADGTIQYPSSNTQKVFSSAAAQHHVIFVDMTSDFEQMYYIEHHVAHGFSNTELCSGHMNQYGHAVVAKRLSATIMDIDHEE